MLLKYRLGHIPTELKMKCKRFYKRASEEYNFGFCYALPLVVVTPVDLGVNENPQPLVDANQVTTSLQQGLLRPPRSTENKFLEETAEEGLPQQLPLGITATASRSAGAPKAVRHGSGEDA